MSMSMSHVSWSRMSLMRLRSRAACESEYPHGPAMNEPHEPHMSHMSRMLFQVPSHPSHGHMVSCLMTHDCRLQRFELI